MNEIELKGRLSSSNIRNSSSLKTCGSFLQGPAFDRQNFSKIMRESWGIARAWLNN